MSRYIDPPRPWLRPEPGILRRMKPEPATVTIPAAEHARLLAVDAAARAIPEPIKDTYGDEAFGEDWRECFMCEAIQRLTPNPKPVEHTDTCPWAALQLALDGAKEADCGDE